MDTIKKHFIFAILIRIIFIVYGEIQDNISIVSYTDIDYKVVTDASRYLLNSTSPFLRHTFRYSPILAYLMIPNLLIHKCCGKLIFSIFDILVGIFIKLIVDEEIKWNSLYVKRERKSNTKNSGDFAALLWLYNPLVMVISTRGNGDSISSFLVLVVVFLIQRTQTNVIFYFIAGIFHGLAIHLRLYPIIFSLAFFLCCSEINILKITDCIWAIIKPNKNQIFLTIGSLLSFTSLTLCFYKLYGFQYIQEAYVYHFTRQDAKHNFSLSFLMQYLNMTDKSTITNYFFLLPQIILLLYVTLSFGIHKKSISFCIFSQVFIMVTYNSVVTSQYFVWYLALLPLCIHNLNISLRSASIYFVLWLSAQLLWLLPAYFLEFEGRNTFNWIGFQGVLFFFVNIFILRKLILHYNVKVKIK